jgi:predicted exporter
VTVFVVITLALSAIGIARLHSNDDLRSLQSSPPALMAQQIRLSQLLGMPARRSSIWCRARRTAAAARRSADRTPACTGQRQAHRRLPRDQ